MRSRLDVAMSIGGWSVVLGATVALGTQLLGTPSAAVAGLQSLSPFAIAPLVVVATAAAWRGRHQLGFVAALAGLGYLVLMWPMAFPDRGPEVADGARTVTLLSANVLNSNDRIDQAADELLSSTADVLAMAEITPELVAALRNHRLAGRYPHRIDRVSEGASGLVVWSRFPIRQTRASATLDRAIDATVVAPDGQLRLVFVHPPPPVFRHQVWHDEIDAIPEVVAATTLPTVVFGDFNSTIFHPPFRRAVGRAGLVDALPAAGHELSMTWPTDEWMPPFVAIDHILIDRQLAVVDAGMIDIPGADHRAIWASIGRATLPMAAPSG